MEEKAFWRKVGWCQFFCCLLVIWNHAGNVELFFGAPESAPFLRDLEYGVFRRLAQISVPSFFMLSAYLFYRGFTWQDLPGKWKRRAKSLLLPYLIWNLLYYIAYLAASYVPFLSGIVGREKMPFSVGGLLRAVLLYEENPVFWFMFQLILLTALAPVLYLALKRVWSGLLWIALLFVGIEKGMALPLVNMDALVYYSVAAFFALHGRKAAEAAWDRYRGVLGLELVALGVILSADYYLYGRIPFIVWCRCLIPLGLWLLMNEAWFPERKPWMECTFFVYAFHFPPVRLINKLAARLLPGNTAAALICFAVMPFAAYALCWQAARFLRRFAPGVWQVLSGGR